MNTYITFNEYAMNLHGLLSSDKKINERVFYLLKIIMHYYYYHH